MCALVTSIATDANAVALATAVTIRVHEHLEQAHPVMQVVKLGVDAPDDRLSEFGERVFEVLNEAHCHWNHDIHEHVTWEVFATLRFAPVANALPVLVDFFALNLLNANDNFVIVANGF